MPDPELILRAKSILTMNPAEPRAEAIAIRDGRIEAVGSREAIESLAGPGTERVDLGDSVALPGLVEPHTHPDLCAQCYAWTDVSGFTHPHIDGVLRALREAVAQAEPGEWIYAFGLDPMLTAEVGSFGRDRLDAIAPRNPIAVMLQSMHTVFVNSRAFEAAGVTEDAPDPPGGGRYQRDASGRLTGKLVEAAAALPFLAFDRPSEEVLRDRMWAQYERYARAGITTIGIPGLFTPLSMLGLFEAFATRNEVPIRAVAYLRHHQIDGSGYAPGDGNDRFRVQGVKLWYDGSPYSGTMLLDEPYLESRLCCCTLGIPAGTTGHANFDPGELRALMRRLRDEGWQVLTHAQGDRGTREIVDLYAEALSAAPDTDHRWRLEHCALVSQADLERMAALGVTPSFHVNHVYYYGEELRDSIIGEARADRLMPVGAALRAGHRVSLHADSPMYPPEPFRLAATAVTRRSRSGAQIAPDQAITALQALRAITIDAAWQLFAEERIGSLEVGKYADVTVVNRDPLAIEPEALEEISVRETWLSGVQVSGR